MEEKLAPEQRTPSLRRPVRSPKGSVETSVLETKAGAEYFLALETPPDLDLAASWQALEFSYQWALRDAGLDLDTEVFVRLHVSDALNQISQLRERIGHHSDRGLVSIIGQSPLQRNKIALEAYHVKGRHPCRRQRYPGGQLVIEHGHYQTRGEPASLARRGPAREGMETLSGVPYQTRGEPASLARRGPAREGMETLSGFPYQMIWGAFRPRATGSSAEQTTDVLQQLEGVFASHGGSICENLLRTWFFVRDIDRNYQGLVEARRELFERCGMTASTHYVSSTGIAGELQRHDELVAMDALLECGLDPAQIRFMTAENNLCPTHRYGVTFERGTRVAYGDRTHCFISGTASIDSEGNILHEGDLDRQVERTLVNIEALLANQGAHLSDLKQAVVYLRDPSDGARARMLLASLLPPSVPLVLVEGRVCRPGWLVEIEGIAVTAAGDSRFADYF